MNLIQSEASGNLESSPLLPVEEVAVGKEDLEARLNDSSLYHNRELSWLKFNDRVLYQAKNKKSPLLERVKFLAISGSNMDEFYMKRIGGLKQQVAAGIQETTVDGLTPQQQIDACHEYIETYQSEKERVSKDLIFSDLAKAGIEILKYNQLTLAEQQKTVSGFMIIFFH